MAILQSYFLLSWPDQQEIKKKFIPHTDCPKCGGSGIDENQALRDVDGNLIPAYNEFGGFYYCQCRRCGGRGSVRR